MELERIIESLQMINPADRNTGKSPGRDAFFVWCDAGVYDSSYG